MKNKWINVSALMSGGLVSLCCGVPLLLALIGAGGLGFSNYIGKYHWFLTGGGVVAIVIAWFFFLREKKKAHNVGANLENEKFTKTLLTFASLFVAVFIGFNVYSYGTDYDANTEFANRQGTITEIKIAGMTCATCEMHVEGALNKIPGVYKAKASVNKSSVVVDYNSASCSKKDLYKAINSAGYKAIHN